MTKWEKRDAPGTIKALEAGCKCPVYDNHCGLGRGGDGEELGWWVNGSCPVHGGESFEVQDQSTE